MRVSVVVLSVITLLLPLNPEAFPTQFEKYFLPAEVNRVERLPGNSWRGDRETRLTRSRKPASGGSRIDGGSDAVLGEFPSISYTVYDDAFFCTAVIISDKWVLTAASCFEVFYFKVDVHMGCLHYPCGSDASQERCTSSTTK